MVNHHRVEFPSKAEHRARLEDEPLDEWALIDLRGTERDREREWER